MSDILDHDNRDAGLESANGDTLSLRFGGLQFGGGLRFRFGRTAARREPPRRGREQMTQPDPAIVPSEPEISRTPVEPAVRTTAVLKIDSPVFVRPGALAPLRTLAAGTRVKVREQVEEWLMIEFRDAQWGARVGYVLRENCEW